MLSEVAAMSDERAYEVQPLHTGIKEKDRRSVYQDYREHTQCFASAQARRSNLGRGADPG